MSYPIEPRLTAPANAATVIARGVKVEGDFASQGDVVIEGEVQGKIAAAGTLTVGPEAVIKADITADEAIISGYVEGNVSVKKQAVFHATARIKGDIVVERVVVESGAAIEGRMQIGHVSTSDAKAPAKGSAPQASGAPATATS